MISQILRILLRGIQYVQLHSTGSYVIMFPSFHPYKELAPLSAGRYFAGGRVGSRISIILAKGYLYGFFVLSKVSYIIPQEHTYILWGIFGYLAYQESLRLLISFLLFFPLHVFLKISATMIGMDVYATG